MNSPKTSLPEITGTINRVALEASLRKMLTNPALLADDRTSIDERLAAEGGRWIRDATEARLAHFADWVRGAHDRLVKAAAALAKPAKAKASPKAPKPASGPTAAAPKPAAPKSSPRAPKPASDPPEAAAEPALLPDLEQAGRFIEALTGSRDTVVTFQTFDDNKARKDGSMAGISHGTLAECAARLTDLNQQGAGIFICVNETDLKGRKAENIIGIRATWGDFDKEGAIAWSQAAAEKLPPSIEVESSPGKRHLYWLTDGVEPYGFALMMDALTPAIGADLGAKSIERVLRLPGFFHRKGEPVMVKLLFAHPERRYTEDQITAAFDLEPLRASAGRGAAPDHDAFGHVLTEQQIADAREVIAAMRGKGLHISDVGHGIWHKVALALCQYGEIGEQLFDEFSQGDSEHTPFACRTKIEEKRKAVGAGTPSAVAGAGIGNLFKIAAEHGIANPAAGRGREQPFAKGTFIMPADDVEMEAIDWLWKWRLAKGMFHLLGGVPGTGKSTLAFTLAATISAGGVFPDGTGAPKGRVLIWSGEDSYSNTIKPRLVAAGANMENIGFLNGAREISPDEKIEFDPAIHMNELFEELKKEKVPPSMLIIDPIVSATKGDNHKNNEVRRDLQKFVDMLKALGIVGFGITHFTKGTEGKNPKDRFNGSVAYIALARVGFCTVQQVGVLNDFSFVVAKSNIGPEGGGHRYHIDITVIKNEKGEALEPSLIVWDETLNGDAAMLIEKAEGQKGRKPEKLNAACCLLRELLANGPVPFTTIEDAAENAGISIDTIQRAGKRVGIVSEKINPDDSRSPHQWRLRIDEF